MRGGECVEYLAVMWIISSCMTGYIYSSGKSECSLCSEECGVVVEWSARCKTDSEQTSSVHLCEVDDQVF
jgi:hypothetical protein